jgi:acyl carrier protein
MTATADLLIKILHDKFDIDPAKVTPESTLEDIGIDSLDTFDVIFTVEDTLGIKVPNDDVNIAKFQDLVDLIDRTRSAQGKA